MLFIPSCLMYNKITYRFPLAYNIFVSCVLFHCSSSSALLRKEFSPPPPNSVPFPLSTHLHTALLRKWSAPRTNTNGSSMSGTWPFAIFSPASFSSHYCSVEGVQSFLFVAVRSFHCSLFRVHQSSSHHWTVCCGLSSVAEMFLFFLFFFKLGIGCCERPLFFTFERALLLIDIDEESLSNKSENVDIEHSNVSIRM